MINHVVSFSGGRTSAYMVYLIERIRKSGEWQGNVEYIFMDTGAEHPKTYEFIKKCVEYFGIELTCLRGDFNQPVGVGHTYKVVPLEQCDHDMIGGPFAQLMRKYGAPTVM
ncbi:phosphoadenosine phosphosulfate reductase domain-containing protein, partial [Arsukibacterium sp.]|uniref:phosphoadenosine phosphosulfate reductase domain-containing protein n=1 Tax=Arsukibacterium sp. TaxID=1977258 RepID=UPI002FD889D8